MKRANTRLVLDLRPDETYSRHSEGDFLRLNDGRILFAYSSFIGNWHDDTACDIFGRYSADDGNTWSEPVKLIEAKDHGVQNVMSLSLIEMQNGDLGLIYIIKQSPVCNRLMLSRSKDGGKTFYKHTECTLNDRNGIYVLNNDRAERLENGWLILPLAYHRAGQNSEGKRYYDGCSSACFLLSDDDGETWTEAPDVVHPPFQNTRAGLQEPGVIQKKNGVLWAYFRTDKMYQYECFSMDEGLHWSLPQPSRFTSPLSPMKIKRNPYNDMLLSVWNPVPFYNGRTVSKAGWGRTPFVCAVSSDDGNSWSEPVIIEDHPEHGYCYPSIFFLNEKEALIAYCSGGPEDNACLARLSMTRIVI